MNMRLLFFLVALSVAAIYANARLSFSKRKSSKNSQKYSSGNLVLPAKLAPLKSKPAVTSTESEETFDVDQFLEYLEQNAETPKVTEGPKKPREAKYLKMLGLDDQKRFLFEKKGHALRVLNNIRSVLAKKPELASFCRSFSNKSMESGSQESFGPVFCEKSDLYCQRIDELVSSEDSYRQGLKEGITVLDARLQDPFVSEDSALTSAYQLFKDGMQRMIGLSERMQNYLEAIREAQTSPTSERIIEDEEDFVELIYDEYGPAVKYFNVLFGYLQAITSYDVLGKGISKAAIMPTQRGIRYQMLLNDTGSAFTVMDLFHQLVFTANTDIANAYVDTISPASYLQPARSPLMFQIFDFSMFKGGIEQSQPLDLFHSLKIMGFVATLATSDDSNVHYINLHTYTCKISTTLSGRSTRVTLLPKNKSLDLSTFVFKVLGDGKLLKSAINKGKDFDLQFYVDCVKNEGKRILE